MSIRVADQNTIMFQYESGTYATPSGTSGSWLGLVTNHDPSESQNVINIRYAGTTDRNVGQFVDGPVDYENSITYHPQDWIMLGFAMGSMVDSGSPSPFIHNLAEVNSDDGYAFTSGTLCPFASFTIVDQQKTSVDGNHQVRTYKGGMVDSWSLSASEGEAVECEMTVKTKELAPIGSATADLISIADEDTTRPYVWSDVKVQIDGVAFNTVTDVSFEINNNLSSKHYMGPGSREIEILIPENREYTFDITADSESSQTQTLYDSFWQNGSTFNALLEISASAGSKEIFIAMSGCKLTDFNAPSPAEGVDEYTATIMPETVSAIVNDLKEKYNIF